ncbi:MAG: succinate--CoA ligase subunit alpha [Alkalispirochaeta sp.]
MSIFVDENTRIIVQGITGKEGAYWTGHMLDMGATVVAGVTPGKEGQDVRGVPVYHSVARARAAHTAHTADAAMLFVPPRFTKDAVFEALDAGIQKVVTIADGIPLHDQIQIRSAARSAGAQVVGGNTSGVISPGKSMLGIFPYWITRVYNPGSIGVMTRSGSLTNEVTSMIVQKGFGVSSLIGVGGDPVPGSRFAEFLPAFEEDPETEGVVIVGELGGTMEEEVAQAIAEGTFTKPLVAFIGGRTAPKGKRMGHAGAIVTGTTGTVAAKTAALESAGARVAQRPSQVGTLLQELMAERSGAGSSSRAQAGVQPAGGSASTPSAATKEAAR